MTDDQRNLSALLLCLKTVVDPTGVHVTCAMPQGHEGLHAGPRAKGESFKWSDGYAETPKGQPEPALRGGTTYLDEHTSPLPRGTLVRNAHGALYEIHEDMPIEGGAPAVVVDGGRTGGIGKPVWLDHRDFRPGGLEVVGE